MSQFDQAFQAFVNWQTALFCLGIFVITYFIRTLVEGLWKGAKDNLYWNEIGLPLGPIGTGWILVFVTHTFPWPLAIEGSSMAKLFYGGICGIASGWVFSRFRSFITGAADSDSKLAPVAQKMLGRSVPPPAAKKSDPPPPADAPKDPPKAP